MANDFNLADYRKRMDGAVSSLRSEFGGLRTGRANAALLDGITVPAYGSETVSYTHLTLPTIYSV